MDNTTKDERSLYSNRRVKSEDVELIMEDRINHLAIIMDGNARWAIDNNKTSHEGHRAGAENAFRIIEASIESNIKHISLFAFSSENWMRPSDEVKSIMDLISEFSKNHLDKVAKLNAKITFVGNLSLLEKDVQDAIQLSEDASINNASINVYIMVSYGARDEILNACKKISGAKLDLDKLDEDTFKQFLYCPDLPDVDLLIRTGNKYRISNFLLWQSAYAEFYFSKKMWPEFNKNDLDSAINEYNSRHRSFGVRG
jgi:undecaprenyl diphosphate synthase